MKERLISFANKVAAASTRQRIYMWYCTGAAAFLLTSCLIALVRGQWLGFAVALLAGLVFVALALFHRLAARVAREDEPDDPSV